MRVGLDPFARVWRQALESLSLAASYIYHLRTLDGDGELQSTNRPSFLFCESLPGRERSASSSPFPAPELTASPTYDQTEALATPNINLTLPSLAPTLPFMPSQSHYAPGASHSSQETSRDPTDILAELEQQWIFTEDELLRAPSIVDGMQVETERQLRHKGNHFITQVGIMLKLPQTTLSTAAVFFNRFLMRRSLVHGKDYKALHHYQVAAISVFLATKVEEACRKIKELVIACCRVAQKNPQLLVDEQNKDYWRWKDTILLNEDVLLEVLCFDLTIESPYKILYDLVRYYKVHSNRRLRDSAWSFINDSNMTQLCLLFTPRTIACAALYCGAKHAEVSFHDERNRPWWQVQRVPLNDIRKACNYMAEFYVNAPGGLKPGVESIYVGLRSPLDGSESEHRTRLKTSQTPLTPFAMERSGSERSAKRGRDEEDDTDPIKGNGHERVSNGNKSETLRSDEQASKRAKTEDIPVAIPLRENGSGKPEDDAGSEEGEVEE